MLARLLYFIPGVSGCSEMMLQSLGLHDRFIGPGGRLAAWVALECDSGPDGVNGCLVASGSSRPPEYAPESQTWRRVECVGKKPGYYFVGIENNQNKPTARHLVRPVMLDGYFVMLGDGVEWQIPLILRWNCEKFVHESALPQSLNRKIVNGVPRLVSQTQPVYSCLEDIANEIWTSYVNEATVSMDRLFECAISLLATNYRVSTDEVLLLALLDESNVFDVLKASIDFTKIQMQARQMMTSGLTASHPESDSDEMGGIRG